MKIVKLINLIFTMLIATQFSAHAFEFGNRKENGGAAGSFLNQATSARSLSMGKAGTTLSPDASALTSNPAALTQLEKSDLVTLYTPLEEKTNFGFASIAMPTLKLGTLGVGLVTLSSGEFDKRGTNGERLGSADLTSHALFVSRAAKINKRLSYGVTLKGIQHQMDIYKANGYGLDAGLAFDMHEKIKLGFSAKNIISPSMTLKSREERVPLEVQMGATWSTGENFLFALDAVKTTESEARLLIGTEWKLHPMLSLRSGINDRDISLGMGLNMASWSFDYSFAYNPASVGDENMGGSHRFGAHLKFGRRVQDVREELSKRKYEKEGQFVLARLRRVMHSNIENNNDALTPLINEAKEIIKNRGYSEPRDLYETQGYIHFLEKRFEQSAYYISEAINVDETSTADLKKNYEKALTYLNEEQKREEISRMIKQTIEFSEKKMWKASINSCEKILLIDPGNKEALVRLENLKQQYSLPVSRSLVIAKTLINEGKYLIAIKRLTRIKMLDPENETANLYMTEAIEKMETLAKSSSKPANVVTYVSSEKQAQSRALYSEGLKHYARGELKEAVAQWEAAKQTDPTNEAAVMAHRRALLDLNNQETGNMNDSH